MSEDFKAIIREGSPRYEEWMSIMGTNEFPLKSPFPEWASAPGIEAGLFYQIDIPLLDKEQRVRLIKYLASKFSIDEQEVASSLNTEGCPVRDEDVTIVVFNPMKWLSS